MRSSNGKWWQWLTAGAACGLIAIIVGPIADRHGYGTLPGLIVSILGWMSCSVCCLIGFLRFVKGARSAKA
jgi:hypothetical protein